VNFVGSADGWRVGWPVGLFGPMAYLVGNDEGCGVGFLGPMAYLVGFDVGCRDGCGDGWPVG
jgi:hypothetical protein